MSTTDRTDPLAVLRLRWQLYNAELVELRRVHDDLAIFRVRGDRGPPTVAPGQYTLLGLGTWEPRDDGLELPPEWFAHGGTLLRRAYSVSSPVLNERGVLTRIADRDWLEFYITCVRRPEDRPPSLTPRLFALQPGARLFLGTHAKGTYTLDSVRADEDLIFCATGTGEAPHNAMLAELLAGGHRGRIVSAVSVRHRRDLGYLEVHRELERRFPHYRYLPLTTREPENLDPGHPGYTGKRYLQQVFGDDDLCEQLVGFVPQPGNARLFLCGNPAMIGLPGRGPEGEPVFPEPRGMAQLLTERGFRLQARHDSGDVHFEKYW